MHRSYALVPALAAVLFAAPMVALDAPLAHADRGIRVSGGVRASGRVNVRFGGVRVRPHYQRRVYRSYARPRPVHIYTGGSIYWGGGFYYGPRFAAPPPPPPPPPADCACDFTCDERATCVPGTSEPSWCMANEDCPSGSYCDYWSGTCFPSWTCWSDEECGPGMTCDDRGTCVPATCDENADCAEGSYCDVWTGQCIPSWTCVPGEDCGPGMTCDDRGTCVPQPCDENADCAEGCYCDVASGTCIESGFCESDADCTNAGLDMVCEEERFTCVPAPTDPVTCYGEVFCDALAPECWEGTTPGIANGCYTGECIPLELCEAPPPPACEELTTEDECYARADCTATYVGVNCTCQGGGPDCRCSAEDSTCTCERFDYAGCVSL